MASVYCNKCNAKITAADSTCPRCGAPTSRVVPFVMGAAILAAGFMLYSAYQQGADNEFLAPASERSSVSSEQYGTESRASYSD